MKTTLNAQEVYLIERYVSLDYVRELRDAWKKVLDLVEQALHDYLLNLPSDYRGRPLHEQPDIVWGERVLPHFRDAMLYIEIGYKKLEVGDYTGLHSASTSVASCWRGAGDFWIGWMDKEDLDRYYKYQSDALMYAGNIESVIHARISAGSLTLRYQESTHGPLNFPESLPVYKLNQKISVATDDLIPRTGIYLPDADDSAANFLMAGEDSRAPAAEAWVNMDPYLKAVADGLWMDDEYEYRPTIWTLIERVSDTGTPTTLSMDNFRLRCEAGKHCPKEGWWWSPAGGAEGRRFFKEGEVMPAFGSDYGDTIWQWNDKQ